MPATTLSLTNPDQRTTWTEYFDPATRQLMSWTSVHKDNRPAWVVFESAIVVASGVQPADDEWLFPQPSLPVGAAIHS